MTTPIPQLLGWPMAGVSEDGTLGWAQDDASIRGAILCILLTRPGERLQRPDFGAGLLDFVHQPNTETTRNLIAGVVRKSLALWETRVTVEQVEVLPSLDSPADIHINIRYRPRHTATPADLGFTLNLGQP